MDIKHFYIEKGQGEPVILLHGNGENCTYLRYMPWIQGDTAKLREETALLQYASLLTISLAS